MIKMLKLRSFQVILVLILYLLTAKFLPLFAHQLLYTISVFIKDLLVWMLPLTVAFFISHTICSFQQKTALFVLSLVFFEALSNFSSVWYGFASGHLAAHYLPPIKLAAIHDDFTVLWRFPLLKPQWWSADKGTLVGLLLGFVAAINKNALLKQWIYVGKEKAQWVLTHIFSRLIPIFILGFVARMYQTKVLDQLFVHYAMLLLWLIGFLIVYIFILFHLGSGPSIRATLNGMKNLLTPGAIAFTSGCSLSTMPWTIQGAAKNLKNPEFAKAVIPATTNIQQIGDCIINTFLCFLIYSHFYGHFPNLSTWLIFSVVFVLARFATAAVLGGAIFIMLPIYESYLGFNPEMIAIILAFNVILDPLVTSSNVIANGALCRVFEKVWLVISGSVKEPVQQKIDNK